jgi:poly-gamma-glutamate synthesis protein (capsule biosynthesis protein)
MSAPDSSTRPVRLMVVGDLILGEPDPYSFLDPGRRLLRSADLLIGNVEIPHTRRGSRQRTSVPAVPAPPERVAALRWAGFHVGTLAGNHVFDAGPEGVVDTRASLRTNEIAAVGAGRDLVEARRPAIVESGGRTWAVLAYNCVGPELSWAGTGKAGCAYVRIRTPDGQLADDPGSPASGPARAVRPDADDLAAMAADIAAVRDTVDFVVVGLHKGVVHTPGAVLPYEREIAHAVIDAGADVVAAHHAHILRGIEIYRGRPIFHGLGNWVTVTRALTPGAQDDADREAWAHKRLTLFGFTPDPAMPTYPFHPESRNTMVGVVDLGPDGALHAGLVPCWIDDQARPVPCDPNGGRGADVVAYVEAITAAAGFRTIFTVQPGDPVVRVSSASS